MSTHVVKHGETLSGIARSAGVSVQSLLRANPGIRSPDVIRTGQTITIPATGLRLDSRFLSGGGLRFPRRSSQRPSLFESGELTFQVQLPPWSGRSLTVDDVTRMIDRRLPPNFILSLYGGPGCQAGYAGLCSLLDTPPSRQDPSSNLPTPNIDVGSQVTGSYTPPWRGQPRSAQVSAEYYASLVIRDSAASFASGRIDLFNQPTAQVTLGLGLDPLNFQTPQTYLAMQLSLTIFNFHVLRALEGYDVFGSPQYRDILEAGVQVGVGVTRDASGMQPSGQAGITLEGHVTKTFSITATGMFTLTGTDDGVRPQVGPVTVGGLWHLP